MKGVSRMTRVNELLKREIADLIEKYIEHKEGCLISITEVDVAPSLRNAKVFVSILGTSENEKKEKLMRKIEKKRSLLQEQMAKHVVLKYTPVLDFKLDKRIEAGDNVLAIIQEMEEQEDS